MPIAILGIRHRPGRESPADSGAGGARSGVMDRMNDPHVEALVFRIEHDERVCYEVAATFVHKTPSFCVRIEGGLARFEMKDHHATADSARAVVEPFIQAWELDAGLRDGPGVLQFAYQGAQLIDRQPTPGVLQPEAAQVQIAGSPPELVVTHRKYPSPPSGLAVNVDVDVMYDRYRRYKNGQALLADMANFCLTVFETSAKGSQRSAAAKMYGIDTDVLSKLGELAAQKGGREARKAKGLRTDFSDKESRWIEDAAKTIIRRAAEVADDPHRSRDQITMAELPPL